MTENSIGRKFLRLLQTLPLRAALLATLAAGSARAGITNGNFETGSMTGWSGGASIYTTNVHSGTYAAYCGDTGVNGIPNLNTDTTGSGFIAVPANATLSFWVYRHSVGGDVMNVRLRYKNNLPTADAINPWPIPRAAYSDSAWQHFTFDLSAMAGSNVYINTEVFVSHRGTYLLMDDVEIQVMPTPAFTGTPTSGTVPMEVTFTDTSTAGDGTITNRHWVFGDGATLDTANTTVSHTYTTAGTYTVALTVTDSVRGDKTLTRSNYITAAPPLPVASFTATPTSGNAPLAVTFTDTSTGGGGSITNRHWVFGDGTTLDTTGTSVSHTYTAVGSFTVALTVTNSLSQQNTQTQTNLVTTTFEPLTAGFTVTPGGGYAPVNATFTDTSRAGTTGTITNRHWDFGDGTTLDTTDTSVPHSFTVLGNHTVTLTVTNNSSLTSTASQPLAIEATNPVANGGFETGDLTGWTATTGVVTTGANTHSGNHAALVGTFSGGAGTIYGITSNTISSLPANATLSFWVYRKSTGGDVMNLRVQVGTTELSPYPIPRASYNDSAWVNYTVDLSAYAGQSCHLFVEVFAVHSPTYMLLDDVRILVPTTTYAGWALGPFANAFTDTDPAHNPDGDSLTNLQEYAFGTDPTVTSSGPITYADNVLTVCGPPEARNLAGGANGVNYCAVFCRRKNPASWGLTYTAEFSVDFTTWTANAVEPVVLATDAAGVMEVVSVPYPWFIPTSRGVEKPTFYHVKIESN